MLLQDGETAVPPEFRTAEGPHGTHTSLTRTDAGTTQDPKRAPSRRALRTDLPRYPAGAFTGRPLSAVRVFRVLLSFTAQDDIKTFCIIHGEKCFVKQGNRGTDAVSGPVRPAEKQSGRSGLFRPDPPLRSLRRARTICPASRRRRVPQRCPRRRLWPAGAACRCSRPQRRRRGPQSPSGGRRRCRRFHR